MSDQPESPVENNGITTRLGGCTGKGFMPGQSGNPGGRPKSFRRLFEEAADEARIGDKEGRTKAKALVDALIDRAIAGSDRAAQIVIERTDGSVAKPEPERHIVELSLAGIPSMK